MNAYPDTSFLCALYRSQTNSAAAVSHAQSMTEPVHVASPLLYEFRQSIRLQAYLHSRDPAKGYGMALAKAVLAALQANIRSGGVVVVAVDWAEVVAIAERLSDRYTWTDGYRGFDLIHVATALHLAANDFLSFDVKQRHLAAAEGLGLPL